MLECLRGLYNAYHHLPCDYTEFIESAYLDFSVHLRDFPFDDKLKKAIEAEYLNFVSWG